MRILVVSPVPSHPQDQGNSARLYALARVFKARDVQLDLVYYGLEGISDSQRTMHERFWNEFVFVRAVAHGRMSYPDVWGLDDWCPDILCQVVAEQVRRKSYAAVIVNYVWMSRVFESIEGPVKILDTHDIFADRNRTALDAGLEPRWYFTSLAEENRGFERADIVIAIQSNEQTAISARTTAAVCTVGHYVIPEFLLETYDLEKPVALFGYIGSSNPWNRRSIHAFDAAIKGASDLKWMLAGTICDTIGDLRSNPVRIGRVRDIADFYYNVGCVVNPMVGGTGLKIKTVEAMSFGKAVLGTQSAFDGIPSSSEFHNIGSLEDFVDMTFEVAGSPHLLRDLSIMSRRIFIEYQIAVQSEIDALLGIL